MSRLIGAWNLLQNMGLRYVLFRIWYEFRKRTGLLKAAFPTDLPVKSISLEEWRRSAPPFFFSSGDQLGHFPLSTEAKRKLEEEVALIAAGSLRFFSSKVFKLGTSYDWVTNPDTGYRYDAKLHWTRIPDFDPTKGDIKYVWEKSRFSFLYTLIRYDKHVGVDQSAFVFQRIEDWIAKNPLNCGPNYVCSQETSLRILNWTFALYYYRNSVVLNESLFQKIMQSIYGQLRHVESNIHFSRIAVRNNHAITETMMLLLGGVLFPFFPQATHWKKTGLRYFQEEVLYQVYKDGSYIQYSMNYQRVVVQLFTWALILTDKNGVALDQKVKQQMRKCLDFMLQLQDDSGQLPNYGANDGALFFPLNSCDFRDYRPQLAALKYGFDATSPYPAGDHHEDVFWLFGQSHVTSQEVPRLSSTFAETGYYTLRSEKAYSFIRCGNHKDRPSQADNLHVDLWVDGVNLLRDAGSYKYNSTPEDMRFFMGTASHNTVQIGAHDQMKKGGRFIWYHWSEAEKAAIREEETFWVFEGVIVAYKHLGSGIRHKRTVKQHKTKRYWEIEDIVTNPTDSCTQIWNLHPDFDRLGYKMDSVDEEGAAIIHEIREGYYSSYYGQKETVEQRVFRNDNGYFFTRIWRD